MCSYGKLRGRKEGVTWAQAEQLTKSFTLELACRLTVADRVEGQISGTSTMVEN